LAFFAAATVARHAGSFVDGDDSVCGDVVQPAGKSLIRSVDARAVCLSDLAHAGDANAITTATLAVTMETAIRCLLLTVPPTRSGMWLPKKL
jgi:hypothetical protein